MDGPKSLECYLNIFDGNHMLPLPTRCFHRQLAAIEAYIDSWPEHWRSLVKMYADVMPELDRRIRVVALIPARNEQYRISACLKAIKHDILTSKMSDAFELIILENGLLSELGPTASTISDWIKYNKPSFAIHVIKHCWESTEQYPLAKARKLLADITVYRIFVTQPTHSVYLLSEDADIERIQAGRTRAALLKLDKQPSIDAIKGIQERSIYTLIQNNLALLERRGWQFTELLLSSKRYWPGTYTHYNFYWHRVVTAGSNVFFSAEIYSLISGYSDDVAVFEDMDIGQRISVLRGQYLEGVFLPRLDTIRRFPYRQESSIARVLLSLVNKEHVYGHDGTGFYDVDSIIKRPNSTALLLQKLAPYSKPQRKNLHRYENVLSNLYKEVLRIFIRQEEGRNLFWRVMRCLGLNNKIHICTKSGDVSLISIPVFQSIQDLR